MRKPSTTIRITEEARQLLKRLAEQQGISQAAIMEIAIRKYAQETHSMNRNELLIDYVRPHLWLGDRIHPLQMQRVATRNELVGVATVWQRQPVAGLKITVGDLAIDPHTGYGIIAAAHQLTAMAAHAGVAVLHPKQRAKDMRGSDILGDWSSDSYIVYPE